MQKKLQQDPFIRPEQLCIGLYVHLDLSWTKHPFSFSSFKIENAEQIKTIQKLGLQRIRYTPNRSDCYPAEVSTISKSVTESEINVTISAKRPHETTLENESICKSKHLILQRIEEQGEKILACEREFLAAVQALKAMWQNINAHPSIVSKQARELMSSVATSAMMESEIAIHLMIDQKNATDIYTHAMNVAVLSMILAKEMRFTAEEMKLIGLGALFHDVGCTDSVRRIKEKGEPITPMDQEVVHQHCKNSVDICNKLQLPYEAIMVVWQHHERIDGSGYPEKLKNKQISPLANIVAVADTFDEMCNPINRKHALTPHETLSILYAQQRTCFDGKALTALVHCLGVYPPGTIVLLSNGIIGMVIAVNSKRPLKPTVLVYDPATAKDEAILIDLEQETGVNVTKTIHPNQLSPEIFEFLSVGKRTSYYFKALS